MELGYDFTAFGGRASNIALGYQGTGEAVSLGLPERKWLAAFSTSLYENTTLAVEYSHADDYGAGDTGLNMPDGAVAGTGNDGGTVTLQVAVEF